MLRFNQTFWKQQSDYGNLSGGKSIETDIT